jgi:hypothetical protein
MGGSHDGDFDGAEIEAVSAVAEVTQGAARRAAPRRVASAAMID